MTVERNKLPENLQIVVPALKIGSIGFIILGICCFMFPDIVENILGPDDFTRQALGGSLIFVGLIEYFVALPILIKNVKDKKDD